MSFYNNLLIFLCVHHFNLSNSALSYEVYPLFQCKKLLWAQAACAVWLLPEPVPRCSSCLAAPTGRIHLPSLWWSWSQSLVYGGESMDEDKKCEESSSHFKTAELNCHLEVPASLLCSQRQPRQQLLDRALVFRQLALQGVNACSSGRWTEKTWMQMATSPVAKGLRAQHWNLEHSVPFPKYKKSLFLPFRALNVGLATERSSKSQADHLWIISFSFVDCFCFAFCC